LFHSRKERTSPRSDTCQANGLIGHIAHSPNVPAGRVLGIRKGAAISLLNVMLVVEAIDVGVRREMLCRGILAGESVLAVLDRSLTTECPRTSLGSE
jgi:hypothetical protein